MATETCPNCGEKKNVLSACTACGYTHGGQEKYRVFKTRMAEQKDRKRKGPKQIDALSKKYAKEGKVIGSPPLVRKKKLRKVKQSECVFTKGLVVSGGAFEKGKNCRH